MRLLVDTHLLFWSAVTPELLSRKAEALLQDPSNVLVFSAISIWEASIKFALGRTDFDLPPQVLRQSLHENGYEELAMTSQHGIVAGALPKIHKDPFDRILIAQAQVEGLLLLTSDEDLAKYSGPIRLV